MDHQSPASSIPRSARTTLESLFALSSYLDHRDMSAFLKARLECRLLGIGTSDSDKCSTIVGEPVFPSEVTDMIIDYLHDSPFALRRCSLVCKEWRASCRYHLFDTITFAPEKVAFNDLLAFLASATDVCPFIKHLTLSGYRGISLKDLRTTLQPLSGLRSVTLDRMYISGPNWHEPASDDPESIVGPLDTLCISSCNVLETDTSIFFRLLGLFSAVSSLHLSHSQTSFSVYRPHFGYRRSTMSDSFPSHVHIEHLVLRTVPMHILDLILRRRDDLPHRWDSLRTLWIDGCCSTWEHVKRLGEFLAVIGPQLREVAVRPPYMLVARDELLQGVQPTPATVGDTVGNWGALRLDKCTKLEVFKMSLGHDDHFARQDGKVIFKTTVDLLTHLPSIVIQVRIGFTPERYTMHGDRFEQYRDFLLALDWQALDRTLSDRRFEKLKVVLDAGLIQGTFDMEQCRELFNCARQAMPGLDSRNMLEPDFTKDKWWKYDLWD